MNATPLARRPARSRLPARQLRPLRLGLLASLLPAFAIGQTAPAASTAAPKSDETVVLSPFTVASDANLGYLATSTLAGTRLKTDLRDLGAAITVVTPEFLKDTGATSIEELLVYTPGTEIAGPFGNYSAGNFTDPAGRPDSDGVRREPQSGARVRGFATPTYTRGYFSTSIPTDAYNVESITLNRGANSLLFGLGSAGGVIESSPAQGVIGRNSGSVGFRYGSHDSNRSTLDLNLTLIPRRLALRLDVVNKTDNYQQRPAFDRTNRAFLALNAVVFENKNSRIVGKTVLRGNVEAGKGARTPSNNFAPTLAYESFFLPPPNYTPYSGLDYAAGGGYALLKANWKKWALNDTRAIQTSAPGVTPVTLIAGWYENIATAVPINRTDLVSQNYSSSHFFQALSVAFNGVGSPAQALQGNIQQLVLGNVRTNAVINNHIFTRAYEDGNQNVGFKAPTLTDTNVFDYRNRLITGGLQNINNRFDAHSVTLEQSFFQNRLGFEGTVDQQFYHIDYYQPYGGGARNVPVYVDTSLYLFNGAPNPNAGRALMLQTADDYQWRNTHRDNRRVTAYLDLNAKDLNATLGKWLGRHTFTGLWQKESVVTQGLNYGMYLVGDDFNIADRIGGITTASGQANILQNPMAEFVYLSDSLVGKEMSQVRLNVISQPRVSDGATFNASYFDRTTGATGGVFRTGSVHAVRAINGAVGSGVDVTSKALAWQSKLLGENLVGLLGWREDKIENFRQLNNNPRNPATNEVLPTGMNLAATPATTQFGHTFTWSGVGHVPQRVMERLPHFVSSISGHYGVSENFQAIAERQDVTGAHLASPQGTTKEFGVTLGFGGNKWLVKVNRFESTSANVAVLGTLASQSITEITRALGNYQASVNSNIPFTSLSNYPQLLAAGYSSYAQLFAALKNVIPQPARAAYDYQLNAAGTAWQLPANTGFQNVTAVSDVVAKGWETEITGNPTKNWRVSASVTQVEAITSNSATSLAAFQQALAKNLIDSKLYNMFEGPASVTFIGERYNTTYFSPTVQQRAKDGAASQELRKYRLNGTTKYSFREGRLKGFEIGGSLRWQSRVAIGYATTLNADVKQVPILSQPFFGPSEFNGDLLLGYERKISEKLTWRVQLNARNLIGSQRDIPVAADPDGHRSVYRIAPEKAWYLTNTFSF